MIRLWLILFLFVVNYSFCQCFDSVFVEGGTFLMGAESEDKSERPIHEVSVSSFYIGKYEVTQKEWESVCGTNPAIFKGDSLPIHNVNYYDIQKFIALLNEKTGSKYRLPTEAEWEYAARGGNLTNNFIYSGSNDINQVAWSHINSNKVIHKVGTKLPNELGIYDMSGNVFEWCSDWYNREYYSISPKENPKGPKEGLSKVLRGGAWYLSFPSFCRVAFRDSAQPELKNECIGFRLVLDKD